MQFIEFNKGNQTCDFMGHLQTQSKHITSCKILAYMGIKDNKSAVKAQLDYLKQTTSQQLEGLEIEKMWLHNIKPRIKEWESSHNMK